MSHNVTEHRKAYLREYQNIWVQKRRKNWIDSQGGKCVKCSSTERLEVDHIDPTTKEINPRALWSMSEANERRIKELAKCQVLCYDCHQLKTIGENIRPLEHGTHNAYASKRCRCKDCRKAHANYNASQRTRGSATVARRTHNPKVVGAAPTPATRISSCQVGEI